MRHRKEAELTEPVARYFHRKGFRFQTTELQFYDYCIDIYGFSKAQNLTVSVELKIKNWRRAFEQSLVYQLCSDYVFMALPKETVHRVDQNMLVAEGIGLISVGTNNRCQVIIKPRPSYVISDSYKRQNISWLKQIRSRAYDNR
jgi:hypothetical protein